MSQAEQLASAPQAEPAIARGGSPVVKSEFSTRSRLVLFGLLALLFCGGLYLGNDFLVERPYNAGLHVDPKFLDFGEVWAEKEFKWRIPIENRSDRPVGIASFTASCQCSQIEPDTLTIEPGSTAEVVATIDLTVGRDADPPEPRRKFTIAIHPIVAVATSRPPGFVLNGVAKDPFTVSPREVDLGEILSRAVGEPKTIRLKSTIPLASVEALPHPDMTIEVRSEGETRRQGDKETREGEAPAEPASNDLTIRPADDPTEYLLTVTPSDQIPLGKVDRTILLTATDQAGNKLPDFPVKVIGEVVFDVAVEPREVYAGMIEMGDTYETILTLHSRTGSRFALVPVEQESGVKLEPVMRRPFGERLGEGHGVDADSAGQSEGFFKEDALLKTSFRLRLTAHSRSDQRAVARFQAINLSTGEQADLEVVIVYYGAKVNPIGATDVFATESNGHDQ
jgi:hypothetical protein